MNTIIRSIAVFALVFASGVAIAETRHPWEIIEKSDDFTDAKTIFLVTAVYRDMFPGDDKIHILRFQCYESIMNGKKMGALGLTMDVRFARMYTSRGDRQDVMFRVNNRPMFDYRMSEGADGWVSYRFNDIPRFRKAIESEFLPSEGEIKIRGDNGTSSDNGRQTIVFGLDGFDTQWDDFISRCQVLWDGLRD